MMTILRYSKHVQNVNRGIGVGGGPLSMFDRVWDL